MTRWAPLFLVFASGSASAREGLDDQAARNTGRISVGAAAVMFASYPLSMEDPGPALSFALPLWLGERHPAFQWVPGEKPKSPD